MKEGYEILEGQKQLVWNNIARKFTDFLQNVTLGIEQKISNKLIVSDFLLEDGGAEIKCFGIPDIKWNYKTGRSFTEEETSRIRKVKFTQIVETAIKKLPEYSTLKRFCRQRGGKISFVYTKSTYRGQYQEDGLASYPDGGGVRLKLLF